MMKIPQKPMVSVIIPTYNRKKYVTKVIDSVLAQSFNNYELIVIDDGSIDNTQQALESYKGKIQYVYQVNSGVSVARNAGIRLAKGEWVAFLDSDDEWTPEYLSWQMKQVQRNPQAVTHITNAITILPDGQKEDHFIGTKLFHKFKGKSCIVLDRPFHTILKYSPWFVQSAIIRKETLLRAGLFNTDLTIAEDLDLIARLSLQGTFGFYNEVLVHIYRREEEIEHLASQVVNDGIYSRESFAKVLKNLKNSKALTFREKAILAKALSSNRRALANILLRAGKQSEARYYYKKALFIYPSHKSLIKYLFSFLPYKAAILFNRKGKHIKPGIKSTIAGGND